MISYTLASRVKKCFFFVCILLSTILLQANETELKNGVKGIWFGSQESDIPLQMLNAKWIWVDEKWNAKVILARKTFTIPIIPDKSILRITASSQYQLYINGDYVCRGPARCAPHHQSYDIFDITSLLRSGKNIIAIRVHHQDGKRSYQYEERSGLLAQLTLEQGDENQIIDTDSSWKIIPDTSWDNDAPKISRFNQAVNDRIDFRKYLHDWNKIGFNDSNWENATELIRINGWPAPQKNAKAQPLVPPWTSLVARDIPYLTERKIKAEKLIEAVQIDVPLVQKAHILSGEINLNQKNKQAMEIPACNDANAWLLIYDFGEVVNGMPQLDIQGTSGTELEIITAPFMVDNIFTHVTVDSEFRDKIILSGNRDKWEATYFKPARFLGIMVKNTEPVQLYSAGIHQIEYPFKKRGEISSTSAPWIDEYFKATAKTIHVCTTDAITDNYRERRQYAQTGYYGALGNYYIFGDFELQRRYLIQVAQEQLANGLMPAYAPLAGNDYMVILDSNCLYIRSLYNYLLYSGDYKTVRDLLPAAQKMMELLHSFTMEGMIYNPPHAYWLDHALNDRRGANLNLNGHYLGALRDFAKILFWLNDSQAEKYKSRTEILTLSLKKYFWNEKRQLFADAWIDGKQSEMFSEHANAMALAMNIATKEQADTIARHLLVKDKNNYIFRESGVVMVTPAMSYFLHKGLCEYGYVDESFELFRSRFDQMLAENTNKTLWEEWWLDGIGRTGKFQKGRTRSDAQTESAFPPALFAEYLLGVQVTKPGMKELLIQKTNSGLNNIEGIIPTPHGIVNIQWINKSKANDILNIEVPDMTVIKVDMESFIKSEAQKIILNDQIVDPDKKYIILSTGKYSIKFR